VKLREDINGGVSLDHFLQKQDKQRTYKRTTEGRSCNHWCSGKAIIITYCECVCVCVCVCARVRVALVIQYAMRMRHNVVCGLPSATIFFLIIPLRHDFREKKVTE
jgi:hypothetical protein